MIYTNTQQTIDKHTQNPFAMQAVARKYFYDLPDPIGFFQNNARLWIETHLVIRTKDRRLIPFLLNPPQRDILEKLSGRDLILKARQLGFTTLCLGLYFWQTMLFANTESVLVAHESKSTEKIFQIVSRFWRYLPDEAKDIAGEPKHNSAYQMYWPKIESSFYMGTAGAGSFGRGATINNLHCSEFAQWDDPETNLSALLDAVPIQGSRIVIESTAYGYGNPFHTRWIEAKEGKSNFRPHFYRWFDDPTYRIEGEPLDGITVREQELITNFGLDHAQIRWRRWKVNDLKDRFLQENPEDDVTCFLTSGRSVFDHEALTWYAQQIAAIDAKIPPTNVFSLTDPKKGDLAVAPGILLVWKAAEKGHRYVIGADVGEGVGGDPSAAVVLDHRTGEQVAELQGYWAPDRFAKLLDVLGRYYRNAVIAVESNNHGHSCLNTLRNTCRYRRLYYYVRYDYFGKPKPRLGWPTDSVTRPLMIDDLASAIAERSLLIRSAGLIDECRTFVYNDNGKPEHQEGKHDDRVFALAIAVQVRKRPIGKVMETAEQES